ncbi:MAG: DEAD/DEAH box helicase [Bacteroidales bacterium]|nr:DEAD/DEAH box helicase [Bacteroidales bacterium]
MNNFEELGLSKALQKVLPELGIFEPTPIQEQAIPILTSKQTDLIGLAQTGTGKTAAFGLPLLDAIDPKLNYTQALILAPTRELGQQIAQQLLAFAKYLNTIRIQAVYGGASISDQMRALKNTPHIIIATPGRLLDLINRKAIKLDRIGHIILDEADEMLNMGFKEDMDIILSFTDKNKLTWLFSATMPAEIKRITKKYMNNPVEITVNSGIRINENIEHQYTVVKSSDKTEALKRFMDVDTNMRGIVFCRTKLSTQSLAEDLSRQHYKVDAIHGDLSQNMRDRVMRKFKDHSLKILIATDVAARGIDVNDLTHIIHYSLPDDYSYYTHRSGRTARAGKNGISLALVTKKESDKIYALEKMLKIKFEKVSPPKVSEIQTQRIIHWASNVADTEVSSKTDTTVIAEAEKIFKRFSKEELITKLVNSEIEQFNYNGNQNDLSAVEDLPVKSSGKDPNKIKFFINLGSFDKLNKKDLLDFICEQTKIERDGIGNIRLQKKFSFFEVDKLYAKKVSSGFKGVFIKGRKLRVNRDNV